MPIYDYRCQNEECEYVFSRVRNVSNRNESAVCPHCQSAGKLDTAPKADVQTKKVANVFRKV